MGVLVGTSLIVIVPEGVETLYSSSGASHSHVHRRDAITHAIDVRWNHSPLPQLLPRAEVDGSHAVPGPPPAVKEPNDKPSDTGKQGSDGDKNEHEHERTTEQAPKEKKEESSPHAWIGVGLISGFLLMYLVDQLPQYAASSSKQQNRPYHISLDNLGSGLGRAASPSRGGGVGSGGGIFDFGNGARQSQSFATTTGLVIHAATDGIALGASSSNTSLSFIIFLAIMVHKAPASFGLTSVLLKQGLSVRAARGHLLVFSLAAPAGAIVTWLVAHTILAGHESDEQATRWRTGMLLLFSAGTFLYVAMHTMQENITEGSRREGPVNGYNEGRESSHPKRSIRDLVASIIGMIIPLFLQIGHA
ncbi:conserved hypothetical protein [Uncinocarpus reesii 1704]|uniref:Uncharacterized protein n=1 Tax=Uncinocarpus reesii (strain UAMH 1704) TaxID=336963 RepID=C4JXE2_UNCRE|nr:uncharacterized protein UREG_06315 [Uncinocarpus reesii 1704]EEP81450.1 conserved hypothetical protein [Uncinocarpus reesii 1704]